MLKPWNQITRIVPMSWLAGISVRRDDWRSRLAFAIYIWFETRRVHAALQADYEERGL